MKLENRNEKTRMMKNKTKLKRAESKIYINSDVIEEEMKIQQERRGIFELMKIKIKITTMCKQKILIERIVKNKWNSARKWEKEN